MALTSVRATDHKKKREKRARGRPTNLFFFDLSKNSRLVSFALRGSGAGLSSFSPVAALALAPCACRPLCVRPFWQDSGLFQSFATFLFPHAAPAQCATTPTA
nr:hypothetical protein [Pandoravirus belohorizontensis]